MSDERAERIRQIAADVFGEPVDALGDDTAPGALESWDSLAQLNLMLALEDEFAIELSPDDIERMGSLGAVIELVATRVG